MIYIRLWVSYLFTRVLGDIQNADTTKAFVACMPNRGSLGKEKTGFFLVSSNSLHIYIYAYGNILLPLGFKNYLSFMSH